MMKKREETKAALVRHCERYPDLQIRDLFKFLYQSSFGCEHMISNPEAVEEYIKSEAEQYRAAAKEIIEPLDGGWCRVHLDCIKEGLEVHTLARLFYLSADHAEDGKERLLDKLSVLSEAAEEGLLPFTKEAVADAIAKWREEGYPACHHSEDFRAAYGPAYRLVKKEYAMFLPLFIRIDRMLREGTVRLAIEGGSAAGKTTLSKLLTQVYDCTVFHMDDFFLRPEQRTKKRFAEPGGNVDRERFLEEVLLPLHRREPVAYRRFDCSTFILEEPVLEKPTRLTVIEGAYSMHPELSAYYNLSVFLEVSPELQRKRIEKRNTPELAKRFFEEWIPMEQRYFTELRVKERCDMICETEEGM